MQINLKQPELVEAIKNYVEKQGITVAGKHVTVNFAARHKKTGGITAEVLVEDIVIPGFTGVNVELNNAPLATVTPLVQPAPAAPNANTSTAEPPQPSSLFS